MDKRTFGILGDSYSTFKGWIPEGQSCYYPCESVDDVLKVEDTWWYQLAQRNDLQLVCNDSYSGATVCTHTRDGQPFSSAFTERAKISFSGVQQPDYIFVFGCTNDSWLERSIGQVMYENRTEEDLKQVLPAYCCILEYLTSRNPYSKVVAIVNTQLHPDISRGIVEAGEHYGASVVVLEDIHKQNGHPTALGMSQIAEQVAAAL